MTSQGGFETAPVTDSEQLFSRAWALQSRKREISSSQCSSPVSPKATGSRSREKRPLHRKAYSEASVDVREDRSEAFLASHSTELVSIVENRVLAPTDANRLPEAGAPDLNTSRKSSISERARRLFGLNSSSKTPNVRTDNETSKDNRPSLRWKRQISGRWIEVRIGRKSKSSEQSWAGSTDSIPPISDVALEVGVVQNEDLTGVSSQSDDIEQISKGRKASHATRIGGLYGRAKRRIGLQQRSEEPIPKRLARTNTHTFDVLQRVSSILRDIPETTRTSPDISRTASSQTINGLHKRRTRRFPFSHRSPFSSSSSIRRLRMGISPRNTPDAQEMYLGSDGNTHPVVEMTSRDGPAYLPSEARRIGTPPLTSGSPGLRQGFFLDEYTSSDSTSSPKADGKQQVNGNGDQESNGNAEADLYRARFVAEKAKDAQFQFDFNVPDHLPNSPLCPRHPKNRHTGGKGICVHHGRGLLTPKVQLSPNPNNS